MNNGRRKKDEIEGIVGVSPSMQHVFRLIRQAAASACNVLIQGEMGTGKRRLARVIHDLSGSPSIEFQTVHCGGLPELEIENRLLSAFSKVEKSVDAPPVGHLETSPNSISQESVEAPSTLPISSTVFRRTIFIDEIDRLSPILQTQFLEKLENEVPFAESGSSSPRIIAASDCDLSKEVAEGRFREDLYWRLNILPIAVPPLRRRQKDIEPLAIQILGKFATATKHLKKVDPVVAEAMENYPWPGNIREMETYLERAVVLSDEDATMLTADLLPTSVMGDRQAVEDAVFRPTDEASLVREFVYNRLLKSTENASDLHRQIVDPVEKELLVQILDMTNHVQKTAAEKLGINRNTLYKKLKGFGLAKSDSEKSESTSTE